MITLDGSFWADGCLWGLAPQSSPLPICAVYRSSALGEHAEPRLPAQDPTLRYRLESCRFTHDNGYGRVQNWPVRSFRAVALQMPALTIANYSPTKGSAILNGQRIGCSALLSQHGAHARVFLSWAPTA